MGYLILGVTLLIGLLLALRWYASTDAATAFRVLRVIAIVLILLLAGFFLFTGRLSWVFMTLPALIPFLMRARVLARTAKNFSRMSQAGRGATGQASSLETRFVRMHLNHDSGEMNGEVREGEHAGRWLSDLTEEQIAALLRVCWTEDAQSAQVVEAYLDRVHGGWRERMGAGAEAGDDRSAGGAGGGAAPSGRMSRAQALKVLGLEEGAGPKEVKAAYQRIISSLHPDHGGSDYLAALVNEAKAVLLGD